MKRFINVTILLVLLTLMLVSSCLVGFAKEQVITFARAYDIQLMDPNDNFSPANNILEYLLYDRLVDFDPETGIDFIPALATEWKISPDAKEYTFKLRKGIRFHNGEPFNAECVKVTLERFLHEKALRRGMLWTDLKEVEIVDDYTVIVKFSEINVMCLTTLASTPMLPAKAFKEKGVALFDNPIGTGAFTFGYWKHGQDALFNKNPDYWRESANVADKFIFLTLPEPSTRLSGVLTGEISISDYMTADQIPLIESSPNVEVVRGLAWDQVYLALKTDIPPFTDIKFRQAIALAIDNEGIIKNIMRGGRVATGFIPKGMLGFDDSLVPLKQDVEKAKQLVKESIYDGRTLNLMVPMGWIPFEKEVAQIIQSGLKEVGINVELEILESSTFKEKRAAGKYDMFLNEDQHMGDIDFVLQRILAADVHKMGVSPELKMLVLDQRREVDIQKRIAMLRKIESIMNADFAPLITLYQFEYVLFQQKGITGVKYYGSKTHDVRYAHYEE